MEEECFTAEALAWEVIGRFEHPQTKSVRMESAVSKMVVSELLHHVIGLAEEVHGLAGQTQLYPVEKRKRDARVLNIYEGTNEVQRFLILKDLAAEVAPRWQKTPPAPPRHVGHEALELEALKRDARQRIDAALALFGQELWQNPDLQANCFLLSEAAAWVKAADSTLGRLAWLSQTAVADENAEPSPKTDLARRALARCFGEVRTRLRHFDEELAHLRRGYYAPEVRAARLVFRQAAAPQPFRPASRITRPLRVLVVLEPSAAGVPHPGVSDGRLLEAHRTLADGDRAALEAALRLRDDARVVVAIDAVAVGPRGAGQVLREVLSLGVDRARLVVAEREPVTPDSAAAVLAALVGSDSRYDLILGAGGVGANEEGLLARLTAERLGVPHAGSAAVLAVHVTAADGDVLLAGADGKQQRTRALPASVSVEPGAETLRPFTTGGYLNGLAKAVESYRWPRRIVQRPATVDVAEGAETAPQAEAVADLKAWTPRDAAEQVLSALGVTGGRGSARPFEGPIEDVAQPAAAQAAPGGAALAVVAAGADGVLQQSAAATLQAARMLADEWRASLAVLLFAPEAEPAQRQALGQLLESYQGVVLIVPVGTGPAEMRGRLLVECWPQLPAAPRVVVGEPWTEDALASLAGHGPSDGVLALRVRRVYAAKEGVGLETSRAQGKLRIEQVIAWEPDTPCWVALAEGAETADDRERPPVGLVRVRRWSPQLERFYQGREIQRLLEELKHETGVARLADADFILDVGFGVGNRDGYEQVVEPLERALRDLGARSLAVGGSRKVTEELHLLPADRQIGQSGVSVNPRVLIAIGVSGAPQHVNYIGPRAIVLAFNRDSEAPLMTLNRRQSRPRVFPVVGDLFETVPALTAALRKEQPAAAERPAEPAEQTAR
jgi:electron transfer flavoprotein alpha subunit